MVLIMRVCRANNCTKMRGFVVLVTIKTVRPPDRTSQPQMDEHKPSKCSCSQGLQSYGLGMFARGPNLRARQSAIPNAHDARATRTWPVRRCGSLGARAD